MSTHTVQAVKEIAKNGEKGWTRQKIRLKPGFDGESIADVKLWVGKFMTAPEKGDELEVVQVIPSNGSGQGDHALPEIKIKAPKKGGWGGGGGPRVDDPKTRNSIAMQSSLKLAWEVVHASLEAGLITPPERDRHEWLLRLVLNDAGMVYAQVKEAQDS